MHELEWDNKGIESSKLNFWKNNMISYGKIQGIKELNIGENF